MLHRELLVLQRFSASLFDVLNTPNALTATLSRQGFGKLSSACILGLHRSDEWSLKALKRFVAAVLHHRADTSLSTIVPSMMLEAVLTLRTLNNPG